MNYRNQWLLLPALALGLLSLPVTASGVTLYVAPGGDDLVGANTCTVDSAPCKTISYAMSKITSDGTAGSPHVINIAAGTYVAGAVFTGEIYPINVPFDYVSLVGAGASSTEIVGGGSGYILSVTSTGLSVQGLKFSSAGTAVNISAGEGGLTFSNNIVQSTVGTGVYADLSNPFDNEGFTVAPTSFTGNTFASTDYGVDFKIGLTFDGVTTGLTAAVGNITATGNTFNCDTDGFVVDEVYIRGLASGSASVGNINVSNNTFNNCSVGLELDSLYADNMVDSTVTWGDVTADGNTFDANGYGMRTSGYFGSSGNHITNTGITLGNVSVSNNTLTDTTDTPISVDYFDVAYLYGSSAVTLGNLTVHNNTITATTPTLPIYGIYLYDIGNITYIYDAAAVTTGTIAITDNTATSKQETLYFYNEGVYYLGTIGGPDTADINFGPTTISGNDFTSTNDYAIYLGIFYFGYDQYADCTVDVGLVTVHNNDLVSNSGEAIYFYYHYYSGYNLQDDAKLTIDGLVFTDNRITSDTTYGVYLITEGLAYETYNNSQVTVGPSTITGNIITGVGEALYIYYYYVGYIMYDSSILSMSPWTVSNNTLTTADSPDYAAFTIYYDDYEVASYMEDDSSATLPDWIISNNTIDVTGGYDGIYYYTYSSPDDNYNNAAAHFGSFLIDNNTFNANKDGGMNRAVDFWIEDTCEDCNDSSTFSHGDITVTNNTIYNVEDIAINLDYDDVGYNFDGDGTNIMGDVTIADNMIDTAVTGIQVFYNFEYASHINSSTIELGTLDITGNTMAKVTGDAINMSVDASFPDPDYIDPTSSLTIGKTTISDNTVTGAAVPGPKSAGVWVNADIHQDVVFAAPVVDSNKASGFAVGLGFDDLPEASMQCNTVENNSEAGLFFISDGNFTTKYNSVFDNGLGLKVGSGDHPVVMAENNWWGDPAGPASCASCNKIDAGGGSVDFTPWLASASIAQCGGYVFPWPAFIPAITGAGSR